MGNNFDDIENQLSDEDGDYGTNIHRPGIPQCKVDVNGYVVPHVRLTPITDTHYNVHIGGHSIYASYKEIQHWMPFIAHAMAWAAGYSSHGANSRLRNDYNVQSMEIGDAYSDAAADTDSE